MRYVLTFGDVIHCNGMAVTRHNGHVMVRWINLPGVPKCLLNPGDSAFNYLDSKMITVVKWYHNNDIEIEITGCRIIDVVTCHVKPLAAGHRLIVPEYFYCPENEGEHFVAPPECAPPSKLAEALLMIGIAQYYY